MDLYYYFYFGLLLIAIVLAGIEFKRGFKPYLYLALVLTATFIVEAIAEIMIKSRVDFTWVYHLFNILEYSMFATFLLYFIKSPLVKKVLKISIPVFCIVGLSVSIFLYRFSGFPGININLEGVLLFIVSTYILFNLDESENKKFWQHPMFWISTGILIFFGGTFVLNGIYSNVFNMDSYMAKKLFLIINKTLNIAFYGFIIIGLLCLTLKTKPILH